MSRVTVIVLNYNGSSLTIECLKALERQSFRDFDVVVVDNGSSIDSLDTLKKFFLEAPPSIEISLLPLQKNLGFSGGNNRALELSTGEFIALLNNDTEPEPNWLAEIVSAMETDPTIGICASKMLVFGTDVIDSAGDGFLRSLKGYKRGEGECKSNYCIKEFVFGACAGAALYRKAMINTIGFLDEDFFLIHEDTDINLRSQIAGWKVLFVPTAIVYHKVRSSIGRHSDTETFYTLRNSYLVKIKNIPLRILIYCLPEVLISTFMEFIYFGFKHRQTKLYFKAIGSAIVLTSKMLQKRKIILARKQVSDRYLRSMLVPVFGKGVLRAKLRKLFYD
jgi:GT2 family glycosyltransferase